MRTDQTAPAQEPARATGQAARLSPGEAVYYDGGAERATDAGYWVVKGPCPCRWCRRAEPLVQLADPAADDRVLDHISPSRLTPSTGTTPANEVLPGAVVEYHGGALMLVTEPGTGYSPFRRSTITVLHGMVLTLPADGGGTWTVGGPAEVTRPAPAPVAVREQREDPGPLCPCSAHTRP